MEDTSPFTRKDHMNFMFVNSNKENSIYPLTIREIADAQFMDKMLDKLTQLEKYKPQLIENIQVLCKMASLSSQKNYNSLQ